MRTEMTSLVKGNAVSSSILSYFVAFAWVLVADPFVAAHVSVERGHGCFIAPPPPNTEQMETTRPSSPAACQPTVTFNQGASKLTNQAGEVLKP